MSLTTKLASQFGRPLTVGVISYLGAMTMLPYSSANLMGYSINSNLYYGLLGVAGCFISEIGKNWILPMIPGNMPLYQTESKLIAPVINAGIFAIATKYMVRPENAFSTPIGLTYPALLGAGSQMIGSYVYDTLWPSYA